ncbi:MAG: elongation factor G, partial [Kiritimatiellia bacterium]|nr:elongation factor G [Kiritimatiellia bacterium]
TLCAIGHSARFQPVSLPHPVMAYAVFPKTQGDEDKLAVGLARVAEQDPTLHVERNSETHELVLTGMGDVQINIAVENMKKNTHVEVVLHTPKIAYKETINGKGEGHYKHKKQSGGRGQYGEVYLRVAPKAADDPEWFENAIVGGTIPGNFVPAVQKGVLEGLQRGALAGYPVNGVKVTVYDGSYHDVDSSEVAFKIAGSRALRDALSKAKPALLEPVMKLRIVIPDHCMGDVTGDLNHKRGRILGMDNEDGMQVLLAEIPQAEAFQYSSQLRSITGGRGSFEIQFSRMDTVPANVAQKIIAEAVKHHDEEEG